MREGIRITVLMIILAALVGAVFSPALKASFLHWDDPEFIVNNLSLRFFDLSGVKKIFSEMIMGTYVPLSVLSYAVEYRFFGLDPFVYHLDNLILHVLNVILVFFLARRLNLSAGAGFLAAFVFGIHPMAVEAVAWVTARKDVLCTFFYLLAILSYLQFLTKGRRRFYWLSVLAGLLSILSKATALSLPLVLLVIDWYWRRPWSRRIVWEKILYFAYIIPVAGITYQAYARVPGIGSAQSFLTWAWCFVFYIQKFLWPFPCLPLYQMPGSFFHVEFFSSILIIILLGVFIVIFRRHRIFLFAFMFYLVSIFFLLRFDTVVDLQIVADRFMYFPRLGFCLFLGYGFERCVAYVKAQGRISLAVPYGFAVFILTVLVWLTYQQCRLWSDEEKLWMHTIERAPSTVAFQKLGDYYFFRGRYDDAMVVYEDALEYNPENYHVLLNVASIWAQRREPARALGILNQVIRIAPWYAQAYSNRGVLYMDLQNAEQAMKDLNESIRLNPWLSKSYMNRGTIYWDTGQKEAAIKDYDLAIRLNPFNSSAYYNRGLAYARMGNPQAAREDFHMALKFDPENKKVKHQLMILEEVEQWNQGRIDLGEEAVEE